MTTLDDSPSANPLVSAISLHPIQPNQRERTTQVRASNDRRASSNAKEKSGSAAMPTV